MEERNPQALTLPSPERCTGLEIQVDGGGFLIGKNGLCGKTSAQPILCRFWLMEMARLHCRWSTLRSPEG
jgi:hypothetical protein